MDLRSPAGPAPYRRWTLLDLVGLVATCALAAGAARFVRTTERSMKFDSLVEPMSRYEWFELGSMVLLGLAWLVVLRGLRWDRGERLQLGYASCLGVLIASGVTFALQWHDNWYELPDQYHQLSLGRRLLFAYLRDFEPAPLGRTVAAMATACCLALVGCGPHKSRSAFELLGRLVAVGYVGLFVFLNYFYAWLDF